MMGQPPQTLAQRIRAKTGDAYRDLSDQDLEQMVRAKYPGVYDDIPTTPAQPAENAVAGAARSAGMTVPSVVPGPLGRMLTMGIANQVGDIAADPRRVLPIAGGAAAAALTGGASVPIQMGAAALGGMVGRGAQAALSGEPANTETAKAIATEGAGQALLQGAGGLASRVVGPALQRTGRGIYRAVLKPGLEKLQHMRPAQRLAAERAVAQEGLGQRRLIRPKSVQDLDRRVTELGDEADVIYRNSPATVNPMEAEAGPIQRYATAWQANKGASMRASDRVVREARTNPLATDPIVNPATGTTVGRAYKPSLPARDAVVIKKALDFENRPVYPAQRGSGAEDQARVALANEWRRMLAKAEPAAANLTQAQSRSIDLRDSILQAMIRSGRINPVNLSEGYVLANAASADMPIRSLLRSSLILANRPLAGSAIGIAANEVGKGLSKADLAQMVRALLLAGMQGPDVDGGGGAAAGPGR